MVLESCVQVRCKKTTQYSIIGIKANKSNKMKQCPSPYSNAEGKMAREHAPQMSRKGRRMSHDLQTVLSFPLNRKWKPNSEKSSGICSCSSLLRQVYLEQSTVQEH